MKLSVCLACALVASLASVEASETLMDQPIVVTIQQGPGLGQGSFKLTVEPSDTVGALKRMISLHQDGKLAVEEQQLVLSGSDKVLADDQATLSSLNIEHEAIMTLNKVVVEVSTKATYFGVEADDHEAVHQRLREINDDKFRELFGDDVNPDHIHFHHDNDVHQEAGKIKHGLKNAFKWLYDVITNNKKPEDSTQQPNSDDSKSKE